MTEVRFGKMMTEVRFGKKMMTEVRFANQIRKMWVRKSDSKSVGSQGQLRMQPYEVLRTWNDADENLEAVRSLANLGSWTVARLKYIVYTSMNI